MEVCLERWVFWLRASNRMEYIGIVGSLDKTRSVCATTSQGEVNYIDIKKFGTTQHGNHAR